MALTGTASHATAADGSFSAAGILAWDGTGAHTVTLSGIASAAQGGTGIAFFAAAGPTVARTYTFPDADSTIIVSGGALGTPASGVATNLTGTAAGLTAGTVTTNANLTGPVTSTGNATAIADKAIALAKLADGTAGNVVAYNASGVISAVATGTATHVLTSNGAGTAPTFQVVPVGRFLGTTLLTGATGTFTTNALASKIRLRMVGPGGGGGGASSAAVSAACAAGGSSGGFLEAWVTVSPSTGYSYTNSAGGAGGANTGATGSAGAGTATLIIGAVTYTVNPGNGGVGQTAGTAIAFTVSGAQSAASTGAGSGTEILSAGSPGTLGVRTSGTLGQAGSGGSSPFGGGGSALAAAGAGDPGLGFGAGGGGALVLNGSSAVAGGDGTASIIVIEEFS